MKVFISADMEGLVGVTSWDDVDHNHAAYQAARQEMHREVTAAIHGAFDAGATEVWVKDAHDTGRNLDSHLLPSGTRLIRGWAGHPLSMVQELDESFAAVVMIGYHARAGSDGNPLAHTMSSQKFSEIRLNDIPASEFYIHALAAATMNVPVVFVSGDVALGEEIARHNPAISFLATTKGIGASTISIHPDQAVAQIRRGVASHLHVDVRSRCLVPLPRQFKCEIDFVKHQNAYRAGFFPGVERIAARTIRMDCLNYFDFLKMLMFV